jgi:hypothetical protein
MSHRAHGVSGKLYSSYVRRVKAENLDIAFVPEKLYIREIIQTGLG